MPVRLRRKRVLLFFFLLLLILIAFHNHQRSESSITIANDVKRTSAPSTTAREQFVEIDGKKLRKIDWHDYASMQRENERTGLGEGGTGIELGVEGRNSVKFQELYREHGFNALVSDHLSLDRSVRDIRHPLCKTKLYLADLPSVSIIIPIRNEHLTTLLRSVHSILNRTPAKLLKEIILVDDASGKKDLQSALDVRISNLTKTRVIRLRKREGLIRTRLAGARVAKGDILIFFDSHIEVNVNWLPPLIEPIALDYKTSVCPFIDIVKWENFAYIAQDEGARGAFDWSMFYKRLPLLPSQMENPTEPFEDPVMAGGLFAIDKKWFWELGGYDKGLDVWGGEQYEMSFKIWQCGGRLLDAPCSRVGHIYRQFNPHGSASFGDYLSRNHKRVAAVWMDEYAEYIYKRNPHIRNTNPGDIKKQVQLREKLQCKPFKWFMENVAFDLPQHYPPIPLLPFAEGEIRSMAAPLCIDTKQGREQAKFGLDQCLRDQQGRTGEQEFELTWRQDIRPKGREFCFDVPGRRKHEPIILFNCHGTRGNQHFVYDIDHLRILHIASHLCLDCDLDSKMIFMQQCDLHSPTQQWKFSTYNKTAIVRAMSEYF